MKETLTHGAREEARELVFEAVRRDLARLSDTYGGWGDHDEAARVTGRMVLALVELYDDSADEPFDLERIVNMVHDGREGKAS